MGGFNAGGDHVVQALVKAIGDNLHAYPPPAFLAQTGGGRVYYAASFDAVKAFELTIGLFKTKPVAVGPSTFGHLGAALSVSGSGSQAIVWALDGFSTPGVLHAYTNMASGGVDVPGSSVKFSVPTVANGKVYIGTQTAVAVYGLK